MIDALTSTRKAGRCVRPFTEARAFVQKLGLKNLAEWQTYCKSGQKPKDIPVAPREAYGSEFKGFGDWLGTGTVATFHRKYRSFTEARAFVHQLGLKNGAQWRTYSKSDEKPEDIPADPHWVYKSEYKGMGDWLGTGYVANFYRKFRSFEDARKFVHQLGLKSRTDWEVYCKSGKRPIDIPSNPDKAYGSEFRGMGDWLGSRTVKPRNLEYLSFEDARAFVHQLGLKHGNQWQIYCASGEKPENIPTTPRWVYRGKFKGMGDWLGTGTIAFTERVWRPFVEARTFVQELNLKNSQQWFEYCKSGKKPEDIPTTPHVAYIPEFRGFGDWLGTGTLGPGDREYRSFAEARAFVHQLELKNGQQWTEYCMSGVKPEDIPASPEWVYRGEYRGMGDWLGFITKWNKTALLNLLQDLRMHLSYLEERELYVILQQGGALPRFRMALGNVSPLQVLRDLKNNAGKELEQALKGVLNDDQLDYAENRLPNEAEVDEDKMTALEATHVFEHSDVKDLAAYIGGLEQSSINEVAKALPVLATQESLKVVDQLAQLSFGLDEDAVEYLVANRVSSLWERYISEGRVVVDDLLRVGDGYWFSQIRDRFLNELEEVENLVIPSGWSFTDDAGMLAFPNAMQRRTAWAVREKRRVGNWSGVGSGKTLSAVLASRVIDASATLVITNNSTIKGWCDQIKSAYPDSIVYTQVDDDTLLSQNYYNYVVLNYEKFQGNNRNHLVHLLLDLNFDFIVFDEVQFVKQRDTNVSNRRKALESFVSNAAATNPKIRVLGMSATPVINNLLEAMRLLEIVTGMHFPELETVPTVNNALMMHRVLMLHGFRYRPHYEQEMNTRFIVTSHNELLNTLRDAQKSVLQVEQVLLPAKLEAVRSYCHKGTIIYAHYVDGIVAPIRRFLEDIGVTVGLYTGSDKSGLESFLQGDVDVLIGTSPVGTGLDGLQRVCNRIVMLCLPWTSAEYEQIIGRIRRQGSCFGEVEIIIPQVTLDYEGDTWSWDQGRMACIEYKQTLSDCTLDGHIPEIVGINQKVLLRQSREALERWIERIGESGLLVLERQQLKVPLPPDIRQKALVRHGDFSMLNQKWNTSRSSTIHKRIEQDPSEWYLYHSLYREAREKWPELPVEKIAESIKIRPDWIVGDFGCGECLLEQTLPNNKVIGIDHIALSNQVIACDMVKTPLEDGILDAAVFSLSLMGTNWRDYLKEAYRTLKPYGHLFIAEPKRRWVESMEAMKQALKVQGFYLLGEVEQRYDFIYLTALKL